MAALRWIEATQDAIAKATRGLWAHDEAIRLLRIKGDLEKRIKAAPKVLVDQHHAVVAAHELKLWFCQRSRQSDLVLGGWAAV